MLVSTKQKLSRLYETDLDVYIGDHKLSRLRAVLPIYLLMPVYTSVIQPTIDYAISIWGCTSKQNIYKI